MNGECSVGPAKFCAGMVPGATGSNMSDSPLMQLPCHSATERREFLSGIPESVKSAGIDRVSLGSMVKTAIADTDGELVRIANPLSPIACTAEGLSLLLVFGQQAGRDGIEHRP